MCGDGGEEEPQEIKLMIDIHESATSEIKRLSDEDKKDRGQAFSVVA